MSLPTLPHLQIVIVIKLGYILLGNFVDFYTPTHTTSPHTQTIRFYIKSRPGKQENFLSFLKKLKVELPYHPVIALLGIYSKEIT